MQEKLMRLREKARRLPLEPGVYIMRDAGGTILYIGKAKALRNRVSSYFRSVEKHHPKVYRMVQNAESFETIVTRSEFEALVLESSMIKQYQPKYNILLKDDKGYHYVRISGGDFPRITAEKLVVKDDGARYIGPFVSPFVVSETVDEVNKAFLLPTCKRRFPEEIGKGRPCLNYHIKQCVGVCGGGIGKEEYAELLEQAVAFIDGGTGNTVALLTEKMQAAAEQMDFEKAAFYRDRIRAIQRIADRQSVVFSKAEEEDVLAVVQHAQESCAVVLKIRGQRLVDKQTFQLGDTDSLPAVRAEFLQSYYSAAGADIPRAVLLDGPCEDRELIERFLSEKLGRRVTVRVPERGEGLKLVQMASANAAEQIAQKIERTGKELVALDELARLLGLEQPPVYIEAYDISNYGSATMLGGMVVFENGRPLRAAYKKFNIKTVEGTDDYASMREVVARRLARYKTEEHTGKGFGRLPDLILLDGGRGHVSAVQPVLDEMGFSIPLFGMVKDSAHRTRAVTMGGGEIAIAASRSAFTLVSKIQDEVHRYSITQMKQKHKKNSFALRLTQVPGIGPKRAAALLRHFRTQRALLDADAEALARAPGMSGRTARALHEFLHPTQAD